ncbi:MAG TPA: hypothetical protein VGG61_16960 [Gemmataceae bacterium]
MTRSPIGKVLSIFQKHRVRALLMGGQACIAYGAAEFSRDLDLAVLANPNNLNRLRNALAELGAEPVYFPALDAAVLLRGHACHFRAHGPEWDEFRIDIMSVLHGCDAFHALWARRKEWPIPGLGRFPILSLPDLVRAKKTQRDKDWPMVRRLVEGDYHRRPARPKRSQIHFWLQEARTASLLIELCELYPAPAHKVARQRPAVARALEGDARKVEKALRLEEDAARAADRAYWQPLRAELAYWRTTRKRKRE